MNNSPTSRNHACGPESPLSPEKTMQTKQAGQPASCPTVEHWRYYLPSEKGEGWAVIFMDSTGVFSAVSDWGNYGYIWNAIGPARDVREFVINCGEDYILNKLSGGRTVIHPDKTREAIRNGILEARLPPSSAAAELRLSEQADIGNETGFNMWASETKLDEPWQYCEMVPLPQAVSFIKRVMPRLRAAILAEVPEYGK